MSEKLGIDEEIVAMEQQDKIKKNTRNRHRRYVGSFWLIFCLMVALVALSLWLLRLLGIL